MYFNKMEEEANYFTVTEEEEEEICTCHTCIVSIVAVLKNVTFTISNNEGKGSNNK